MVIWLYLRYVYYVSYIYDSRIVDNQLRSTNYQLVLQTYTLSEILEWNDVSEDEALEYMVDKGFIKLPDPKPIDILND